MSSVAISFSLYIPMWRRILQRRSSGDFSKLAQWMILFLQFIHISLASLARAWWLVGIYALQIVLVSLSITLVYRYYDE